VDCDKIVAMKDGRIAEVGTHAELLAKGGLYRQMYMEQFSKVKLDREAAEDVLTGVAGGRHWRGGGDWDDSSGGHDQGPSSGWGVGTGA
jgi:ABC-type multidrug transport system ATPase subunit